MEIMFVTFAFSFFSVIIRARVGGYGQLRKLVDQSECTLLLCFLSERQSCCYIQYNIEHIQLI